MCEGKSLDFNYFKKNAQDSYSVKKIAEIAKDYYLVFSKGEIIKGEYIFPITVGKYKIFLRKNSAYSSLDVYYEIFVKNKHMELEEFTNVKKNGIVIDIGAGEGYYTLKIKANNPDCKIIAVEPNQLSFELLEKNIVGNNLKNITCVNKAIYSSLGYIDLKIVKEIPAITGIQIDKPWLNKNRINTISVEAMTLTKLFSDFDLSEVDLLKIDTEGSEVEILRDSKDVLMSIKKIVVEYHSSQLRQEVISILTKYDFLLLFDTQELYGDLYFIQSKL